MTHVANFQMKRIARGVAAGFPLSAQDEPSAIVVDGPDGPTHESRCNLVVHFIKDSASIAESGPCVESALNLTATVSVVDLLYERSDSSGSRLHLG